MDKIAEIGLRFWNSVDARYCVALILLVYGSVLRPQTPVKRVAFSILVLYMAYGIRQVIFLLATIGMTLLLMHMRFPSTNPYFFICLNAVILYIFKFYGKQIEPYLQTTFDISGFLMTMVIKSSYLARDYWSCKYERAKKRKMQDSKLKRIGITTAAEYILFLPGILSGPTPTFREFVEIEKPRHVEFPGFGDVCKIITSKENKDLKPDEMQLKSDVNKNKGTVMFPTKQFLVTLIFLIIYKWAPIDPYKAVILDNNSPMWKRLFYLYLFNFRSRMKFHFIWNLADCCFVLHGFTGFLNIDFYRVEFTESVREIASCWNRFVGRWLKEFFFTPLKSKSISLAVAATFVASACLHGLNACYFLFTLSLGFTGAANKRMNNSIRWKWVRQLIMVFFISFYSMPFYLLSLKETNRVWRAVGYYGLFYTFGIITYYAVKDYMYKSNIKK